MRLIKNLFFVDLKNGDDYLLVNGMNGAIDLVQMSEKNIIEAWRKTGEIVPKGESERELYETLAGREYILDGSEETEKKNKLIASLKKCVNRGIKSDAAWFVLTYGCNFACPYCYESRVRSNKAMTVEQVDKVFTVNPHLKRIGFFGGEPLLPGNREVIEHIIGRADEDAEYYVITNGYYLTEYLDLFSRINMCNVQVTIDGTEGRHNLTRILANGGPTYERVLEGIRMYCEAGIPVTIRMNASGDNIEDCFEEKQRIQATEWGSKARFEMQPLFQSESTSRADLYSRMFTDNAVNRDNEMLDRLMPLSDFLYNGTPVEPIIKACDRDGLSRFYDPFGNVYNCILAVGDEKKSIGTYFPEVKLREKSFLTRDITMIARCRECPYSLFCGGGCPNGLPDGMDVYSPNCSSLINEIENTIPLIYKMRQERYER